MLGLKSKPELSRDAHTLARGSELVRYRSSLYLPLDYETQEADVVPAPERTMWVPLSREDLRLMAAQQFDTLFGSDAELASFEFMVMQNAKQQPLAAAGLLVRTPEGLKYLNNRGALVDPNGGFVPNTLVPVLNTDEADKAEVRAVLDEWLDSEEEAASLLAHLASALAPSWSASKYVLLLGEGRNGKSVLLKMLMKMFGRPNVSQVTRQDISSESPVTLQLNGKLLNIVFDGKGEYLKDSSREKSLVVGEVVGQRRLYESSLTDVQTNALFLEGLNHEPKSKDKSTALQKRMVRFQFPNVYAIDHLFEEHMCSERMLGALLALMIDHYVLKEEMAVRLAPTSGAIELQLDHMYANSMALQYIKYAQDNEVLGAQTLIGWTGLELTEAFRAWRLKENDLDGWAEPDVLTLFSPLINTERKSARVAGAPRKVRVISGFKPETLAFLTSLEGSTDDADILTAVVDD